MDRCSPLVVVPRPAAGHTLALLAVGQAGGQTPDAASTAAAELVAWGLDQTDLLSPACGLSRPGAWERRCERSSPSLPD